jgi:hypothetical protein
MKVWLDDERPAPLGWTRVRTVGDAIALFLSEEPFGGIEAVSLDHDLGMADESGYDFLVWLERELHAGYVGPSRIPRLSVHTANPPARKRMEAAIAAIEKAALA